MKHQEVSVDYWAMLKTMFTYGALAALGWIMLRLFYTVFTLPRRLRTQQDNIQNTLKDLQKRFPDLNITEEDLVNAEKELEQLTKEVEEEEAVKKDQNSNVRQIPKIVEPLEEDKKDI